MNAMFKELKWIILICSLLKLCYGCYDTSSWSAFSECSASCGGGLQIYERRCCRYWFFWWCIWGTYGEYKDVTCNTMCCPVDGGWSNWSGWSTCPVTCEVNGGWSDWSGWSSCPVTCEGLANNQYRTRSCTSPSQYCGGNDCGGSYTSYNTCNPQCCPVHGGWSDWSGWSSCPVTCEGLANNQYRTRSCTSPSQYCGGNDCGGSGTSYNTCNPQCCPVNGGWSDWSGWSTCPVTCEGTPKNQHRTRSCTSPAQYCGGTHCTDYGEFDTSYTTCNTMCCPVDGGWATWEEWYACPVTCGTGTHYRYRDCSNPLVYCDGADCPNCDGSYCSQSIQRDKDTNTCNDFACNECGNREIGFGSPSSYTAIIGSENGYGILAESGFYEATCCGVVKSWEFYASRAGELHLMVWRKSGTIYTLAGKNVYIVPSGSVGFPIKYTIRELDRLTIQDGDMLGWYTPGSEIIPYTTDASYPHNYRMTSMSTIEEGNTYDWSTVAFTHDRAYAIRIFTDENTAPFFINLQRTVVIFDDEPVAANIYKVKYYNGDTRDVLTWTFTSTSTTFGFDTPTEYIYLRASTDVGTYTLTFRIADPCGNSGSGSLLIKVYNTPPRITNVPSSTTLHEDVKAGQLLYTLDIYDRQATDTISCVLSTVTPSIGAFTVKKVPGTSNYGINLQPNAPFSYDTNKKHTLLISCDDGKNTAATGYFFVHLQKNHPPRFVNLPASVELDAQTTHIGDLIFTVRMTDDENDTLTFTMTTDPSNGPFQIKDYGDILTTNDMSKIFQPAYNLKISVSDGRTQVGSLTLSVHLTNINDKPVISNLPLPYPFLIEENSAVGKTLYHVRVRDLDTADTHLIYGAFTPTTGSSYFRLTADGTFKILSALDFEDMTIKSYNIIVTATDGKDTATSTISLTVTDQNETPVFHQTEYSVEQDESSQHTTFPSAGFVITDPDEGDSVTYWLDCGNDTWRFTMANTSGEITYAYDYDVDKILTTQYNCIVRAKDTGFNTATTSLIIKIKDINDNPPYFNQTQYAFYLTPYETVGTVIGTVTAYDIDISEYGTITYKLDMTAYTVLYIQIYDNGNLYVNEPLNSQFQYGDEMSLDLTVIDYGGLQKTVKIWIVFAVEKTTTPPTTPIPVTFLNSPTNSLWFTALGVLTVGTVIGILYFCDRYWHSINCVKTTPKLDGKGKNENKVDTDTTNPPKTNKMKSIDTPRPPGNPIFHKNRGRNSANRSTGSFSKIVNTSMCSSSIDTNASSLSIAKNSENDTKENSVSGKVFPSSSSYLYKSKDQTLSSSLDI